MGFVLEKKQLKSYLEIHTQVEDRCNAEIAGNRQQSTSHPTKFEYNVDECEQ